MTSVSAAQHRSIQSTRQQHSNYHRKQTMQRREGKEEKGQEERGEEERVKEKEAKQEERRRKKRTSWEKGANKSRRT